MRRKERYKFGIEKARLIFVSIIKFSDKHRALMQAGKPTKE